jgi:hypothetical protein
MYLQKVKSKETFSKCWFLVAILSLDSLCQKTRSGPVPKCHGPTTLRQTETTNLILNRSRGRDVVLIVNKVAPAGTTGLNVMSKET